MYISFPRGKSGRLLVFLTFILSSLSAKGQNVNYMEYYFDSVKPPVSATNRTQIPLAAATFDTSISFIANTALLSSGLHILYVRARDQNGMFSLANSRPFIKVNLPSSQDTTLTRVEYFFDTDLGRNNGVQMTGLVPGTNLSFTQALDISALSNGLHVVNFRGRDALGNWSLLTAKTFFKQDGSLVTLPLVNKLEYFFNTDPGFGMGIDVPISADSNINKSFTANISALPSVINTLYIRARDAVGKWSIVHYDAFLKIDNTITTQPRINRIEYFWDTDPGYGLATPFTFPADSNVSLTTTALATGLGNGPHTFFVRARDSAGRWSITHLKTVNIDNGQVATGTPPPRIVRMEYFWDTDPGYGLATPFSFTQSPDVTLTTTALATGLSNGVHKFYLRAEDSLGKWSITHYKAVNIDNGLVSGRPARIESISYRIVQSGGTQVISPRSVVVSPKDTNITQSFNAIVKCVLITSAQKLRIALVNKALNIPMPSP